MYGYQKTVRFVMLEYLLVLLFHVVYGYFKFGTDIGLIVLIVSCIMISISFIISLLVKNEDFVVYSLFISIAISTTIIGCAEHTLAHSILIFLAVTAGFTIFMQEKHRMDMGYSNLSLDPKTVDQTAGKRQKTSGFFRRTSFGVSRIKEIRGFRPWLLRPG